MKQFHFPAWWGDLPPRQRIKKYGNEKRSKGAKAADKLQHPLHWCDWYDSKWVSDTRVMIRLPGPVVVRMGREMPLVWCNAFDDIANRNQLAARYIGVDDTQPQCMRLALQGNPSTEQYVAVDYYDLVNNVYAEANQAGVNVLEWRVAPNPEDPVTAYLRGPIIDISGARSAKLVAIVMPMRPAEKKSVVEKPA